MPRHVDSQIISFPVPEPGSNPIVRDESMMEGGVLCDVIDLYPTLMLSGPCPNAPTVTVHYALVGGRLFVDWDLDQLHASHSDYVLRAKAVRAVRGYVSRAHHMTSFHRFRSLTHLVETLKHYDLLPAWFRVV